MFSFLRRKKKKNQRGRDVFNVYVQLDSEKYSNLRRFEKKYNYKGAEMSVRCEVLLYIQIFFVNIFGSEKGPRCLYIRVRVVRLRAELSGSEMSGVRDVRNSLETAAAVK